MDFHGLYLCLQPDFGPTSVGGGWKHIAIARIQGAGGAGSSPQLLSTARKDEEKGRHRPGGRMLQTICAKRFPAFAHFLEPIAPDIKTRLTARRILADFLAARPPGRMTYTTP